MKTPSGNDIKQMKLIIKNSIVELINSDSEIFETDSNFEFDVETNDRTLNRKLHETTINHRLAVYLEKNLTNSHFENYFVDLEYNRYYNYPKTLIIDSNSETVRPDIIIHSRTKGHSQPNLLVVEAKKDRVTDRDISKVHAFIQDENYEYLFGLTIAYCRSETEVLANLMYYQTGIKSLEIRVLKNAPHHNKNR
ncbi:MAG: hypothetical protein H6582_12455 [Crocinitomicaceae bacterium]|nr:hypothetical protein [Crocinitomicaceae bacterium]